MSVKPVSIRFSLIRSIAGSLTDPVELRWVGGEVAYMRRVKGGVGQGDIFWFSLSALDPGHELDCVTRLVAEPYPTYMRPAA